VKRTDRHSLRVSVEFHYFYFSLVVMKTNKKTIRWRQREKLLSKKDKNS
jgi:hypothetical protein